MDGVVKAPGIRKRNWQRRLAEGWLKGDGKKREGVAVESLRYMQCGSKDYSK